MEQTDMVIDHLNAHGSITPREADELYSITRLAAVICVLRKRGMKIRTVRQTGKNKFGKPCSWAMYVKEN